MLAKCEEMSGILVGSLTTWASFGVSVNFFINNGPSSFFNIVGIANYIRYMSSLRFYHYPFSIGFVGLR